VESSGKTVKRSTSATPGPTISNERAPIVEGRQEEGRAEAAPLDGDRVPRWSFRISSRQASLNSLSGSVGRLITSSWSSAGERLGPKYRSTIRVSQAAKPHPLRAWGLYMRWKRAPEEAGR
jgi:hypothetical protein